MPFSSYKADSMLASDRLSIMCVGDSITVGNGSTALGGYRMGLFTQLQNKIGAAPRFVGLNQANDFSFPLCGQAGQRTDQILTDLLLSSPAYLATKVFLIHAGTNDVIQSVANATITANILSMITQIRIDSPDATIWVADIIDRSGLTEEVDSFNTALDTAIQGIESYSASNVIGKTMLLDMNAIVGPYDVANYSDSTHPNETGYALMTSGWYNQIITLF